MEDTEESNELEEDYESMEAEAEELSKQPIQQNRIMRTQQGNIPIQQPRVEKRGRPAKAKQAESSEENLTEATAPKEVKWVAYHQPEEIGVINLETRETIKGFKEEGTATGIAKLLNELNTVIISGGYQ